MSEKRFVVGTDSNSMEVYILDNVTKEYPFCLACENIDGFDPLIHEGMSVVALLNQLNGENEQLRQENDVLNQQLKTKVIVNKQYEELQRVKKENEQLRQTNEQLKHFKDLCRKYCECDKIKGLKDE